MAENINMSFVPNKNASVESRLSDAEDALALLADRTEYCFGNLIEDGERTERTIEKSERTVNNLQRQVTVIVQNEGEDTGAEGSLAVENIWIDYGGANGSVTNNTDYDMSYFAVLGEDALYVYEGIAAGETKKLHNMTPLYDMPSSNYASYSYFYGFVSDYYDKGEYQKAGALSALGAGIYSALSQADYEDVLVIGVTEDWEKTVDDDCNEISYGCLYSAW